MQAWAESDPEGFELTMAYEGLVTIYHARSDRASLLYTRCASMSMAACPVLITTDRH